MDEAPPNNSRIKTGAGIIGAACLLCAPLTVGFEGLRTHPYKDLGGVWTDCYGETQIAMKVYTKAQCETMLTQTLQSQYAAQVLASVPTLADNKYAFAASIDASYSAGGGAFARSPMAIHFRQRDWVLGCAAFKGWRATVHGQPVAGLERRRVAEETLCSKGLTDVH